MRNEEVVSDQLTLRLTPVFRDSLDRLIRLRKLTSRSEAVRIAVHEAAERAERTAKATGVAGLWRAGLGAPLNASPRFASDDDL